MLLWALWHPKDLQYDLCKMIRIVDMHRYKVYSLIFFVCGTCPKLNVCPRTSRHISWYFLYHFSIVLGYLLVWVPKLVYPHLRKTRSPLLPWIRIWQGKYIQCEETVSYNTSKRLSFTKTKFFSVVSKYIGYTLQRNEPKWYVKHELRGTSYELLDMSY